MRPLGWAQITGVPGSLLCSGFGEASEVSIKQQLCGVQCGGVEYSSELLPLSSRLTASCWSTWPLHTLGRNPLHIKHPRSEDDIIPGSPPRPAGLSVLSLSTSECWPYSWPALLQPVQLLIASLDHLRPYCPFPHS